MCTWWKGLSGTLGSSSGIVTCSWPVTGGLVTSQPKNRPTSTSAAARTTRPVRCPRPGALVMEVKSNSQGVLALDVGIELGIPTVDPVIEPDVQHAVDVVLGPEISPRRDDLVDLEEPVAAVEETEVPAEADPDVRAEAVVELAADLVIRGFPRVADVVEEERLCRFAHRAPLDVTESIAEHDVQWGGGTQRRPDRHLLEGVVERGLAAVDPTAGDPGPQGQPRVHAPVGVE